MQKLGYIALYFDQEMATFETSTCGTKEYEMPDGTVISVANERFRYYCPKHFNRLIRILFELKSS